MRENEADLDHLGLLLWRAAEAWKRRFTVAMVTAGHPWYAEARGRLFHLIGDGVKQSSLVQPSNLTKQAVQQFLDELERDGIVRRTVDPDDNRGRIILLTESGNRALRDANRIKRDIETAYENELGEKVLLAIKLALHKI
jgi:DNA-binding MarR family transcriptional regulator